MCAFLISCTQSQPRTTPQPTTKTIALVNAKPITQQELWTQLAESNGQQILDELILTKLLNTTATHNGWTISDTDQQHELDALIAVLDQSTNPQSTPRLIESIRKTRGLGPTRFAALLRRNAILRRMIASDPNLPAQIQNEIQQATTQLKSPPTADQTERITHRATLVAQQRAMEIVARDLLDRAEILVMDRSINWAGE